MYVLGGSDRGSMITKGSVCRRKGGERGKLKIVGDVIENYLRWVNVNEEDAEVGVK